LTDSFGRLNQGKSAFNSQTVIVPLLISEGVLDFSCNIGDIRCTIKKERLVQVFVRDNNVDQALKALKRKMQREGVFREMKLRKHCEKPSERKIREKAEAIRRARKLARKKLQREGLLPPTKPRMVQGAAGRAGPSRMTRFGS
jgi:small subunit ribosomal protein S21